MCVCAACRELSFNLAGAGVLPCVTIVSPSGRTPQGVLVMDYGQVQVRETDMYLYSLVGEQETQREGRHRKMVQ